MDLGRLCLSKVVSDKDLSAVLERKLTPEMMPTAEDSAALSYILDFYKRHREVPSPQAIEKDLPGYKLSYASDPASYYVDRLIEQYVRAESQEALLRVAGNFVGHGDPFDPLGSLRTSTSRLLGFQTVSSERDVAEGALDRLAAYEELEKNLGLVGIPTPWETLDRITQGWQEEDYIGIAARPKTGKTWALLRVAHKAWEEGFNVLFFNKENKTSIMERRWDALRFLLPYQILRAAKLTDAKKAKYKKGLQDLHDNPPKNFLKFIHGVSSVGEIQAKCDEYNPDLVCIDGANLLTPEIRGGRDHERHKALSREVKAFSQSYKAPTIITIQLNRGADEKQRTTRNGVLPITLGDVAGSDAFAQDVDLLLGMEQTGDMRANREMSLIPLAVREAEPEPFIVGWDFETMKSEDKGSTMRVITVDESEEDILEVSD